MKFLSFLIHTFPLVLFYIGYIRGNEYSENLFDFWIWFMFILFIFAFITTIFYSLLAIPEELADDAIKRNDTKQYDKTANKKHAHDSILSKYILVVDLLFVLFLAGYGSTTYAIIWLLTTIFGAIALSLIFDVQKEVYLEILKMKDN